MSKDCGNHGDDEFKQMCRRFVTILLGFALLTGVIALIVFLVLRPTHPRFILQDAMLRQLDLTSNSAPLLSTVAQVTITSRNPNARVDVHYDRLDFYASYKYQQVTLASRLLTICGGCFVIFDDGMLFLKRSVYVSLVLPKEGLDLFAPFYGIMFPVIGDITGGSGSCLLVASGDVSGIGPALPLASGDASGVGLDAQYVLSTPFTSHSG